ncbi:MAG TPA: TetR/AcrR family transcriptional regulator [Ramlibacter sp.]|nr:TetR/AcrR family transcriptional regulator [Ramlibacter sp.]
MATRASAAVSASPSRAAVPLDNREGQLLAIARRLFALRGFEGTSLRDIAQEAHITKAALYYYFPNKDALYERVVIESLESLLESVGAEVARAGTPTERVRAFMRASSDFLSHKRDQWLAGSNAFWQASQVDRRDEALGLRDAYEKLLRRCIADGIAAGEFRQMDAAMAGRLLLSALNHLPRWHLPEGRLSPQEVMDQFLDMVLLGMVKRPGDEAVGRSAAAPRKEAARPAKPAKVLQKA